MKGKNIKDHLIEHEILGIDEAIAAASNTGGGGGGGGVIAETDPLSLHLDQATPQTVSGGMPDFSAGLIADEVLVSSSGGGFTFEGFSGQLGFADYAGNGQAMYLYALGAQPLVIYSDGANGGFGAEATIDMSSMTGDRTYTFPDQTGTFLLEETGLKLDQTTPQTVDNGSPTFNQGITIKAGQKIYFDG